MKKLLFLFLLGGLGLFSCKDEDFGPVVSENPGAPTLTAPAANSSIVLQEDQADQTLPAFAWTEADYGFDAGVNYVLQLDRAGGDFSEPINLTTTFNRTYTTTVGEMNNILLTGLELPAGEPSPLQFRVMAFINADLDTVYSAPVTVNVTPYDVVIVYPQLQVPGNYQGWNPADSTTGVYATRFPDRFEGYVYMDNPAPEFKYTQGPGWGTNWGDDGADGTLNPNGSNILAPGPGMYRLNVNLGALTHTLVATNWGLIGSATPTGWDSDTDMTYDPARQILTLTVDLVPGDIKFRANDAWDVNLGDDGLNKKLEYGGANIPITEAGNYTIELDLSGAIYTYKVIKN